MTETPVDVGETLAAAPHRQRQVRAFTSLTAVQFLQLASGMVTGPLLARALGAEGRGTLAAIAIPIGLAPFVAQLGTGAFAVNRVAQGDRPSRVYGSLALPLLVIGAAVALCSPLIAAPLAQGRGVVEHYLTLGLALTPLALLLNLALDVTWGLSAWGRLAIARALTPVVVLVCIAVLYVLHRLDVPNAAVVTIATGFVPALALWRTFRRIGLPRPDLALTREGLGFGLRAWMGTLASLANQRLDQLLMIPLVPARELGLYAVAVTIASLSTILSSQIVTVVLPRIAAGEHDLLPIAMRCLFIVVFVTEVALAIGTTFLLVPIFGADFAGARGLVYVLLLAWLAQSGVSTLSQSLVAAGRPATASIAEGVAVAITLPGLLVLLPSMGAMGAALVSLAAYSTTLVILILAASRRFGHRISDYLVPRMADLGTLNRLLRSLRPLKAAST
jgi:O-antigen/teichoic acid export membrane protein